MLSYHLFDKFEGGKRRTFFHNPSTELWGCGGCGGGRGEGQGGGEQQQEWSVFAPLAVFPCFAVQNYVVDSVTDVAFGQNVCEGYFSCAGDHVCVRVFCHASYENVYFAMLCFAVFRMKMSSLPCFVLPYFV